MCVCSPLTRLTDLQRAVLQQRVQNGVEDGVGGAVADQVGGKRGDIMKLVSSYVFVFLTFCVYVVWVCGCGLSTLGMCVVSVLVCRCVGMFHSVWFPLRACLC